MKAVRSSRVSKKKVAPTAKRMAAIPSNSFPIVGIGASAGGLEAYIALLSKMPVNTGMAFVLVQHLEPTHESLSVEIISKSTQLEIEEVRDGARVKPNHVYVIPPNYNMGIFDGVLKLSVRDEIPGPNQSIDFFFQSLAQSEKRRAIGVVLSGAGADGTLGLRAIKASGGVTFAQDPKSAKYPFMPQSAIAAGNVDFILKPEEITKKLTRMATYPGWLSIPKKKPHPDVLPEDVNESDIPVETQEYSGSNPALNKIFGLLRAHTKLDFTDYKQTTIKRRIARRMVVCKTKSLTDYAKYLQAHAEEVNALYNDILINVTNFFRDADSFKSLATHVFTSLVKDRPSEKPIRIWVPGCSTGEEVYSIAICLIEFLEIIKKQYPIQIFATDISEQALQKARVGRYSESITQSVSSERLKDFFDKVEGGYKIHKSLRNLCLFSKHDVTSDPPFAKLDLISCRNLLIYFSTTLQKRVIPIFHYALQAKGFLLLGKSENPGENSKLFNLVEKTDKLYSKSDIPTPINFRFPKKILQEYPDASKNGQAFIKVDNDFRKDADKLILSKFAPPGVIVNADLEILQFRGRTVPFLEPASGQPSLNLLKMARPEFLTGLRTIIQSAKKENKSAEKKGLHFEEAGKQIKLDIEVIPTNPLVPIKARTFLVLFKKAVEPKKDKVPTGKKSKAKKGRSKQDDRDKRINELVKELSESKSSQQALVEQFEATQEALTTVNEELQSTNEEFQSTNEEIETAQEELQSTNEELVTVNDELQLRNTDLTTLSGDLNNLLMGIEIPILIVGGDHRIRRFSPNAESAFNLIPTDVGRPISDIKSNFNLNLDALVLEVTKNLNTKTIEVQDLKGVWQRIKIRPYKTVDNKIDGAIITLIDINMLKQKEMVAKETLEYFTSVAETVPLPLVVVNAKFEFQSANKSFYKYFQISDMPTDKGIFASLKIQEPYLQKVHDLFSQTMRDNKPFSDFEVDCEVANLDPRKILVSGGKIQWIGVEKEAILVSFVDVTEQRRLEQERKILLTREQEARHQADSANRSKDVFLATLSHELRTPLSSILTWSQLIGQGKVDFEKAKQGAVVIEQSAKTQTQLINDLLDISRIIAGKLNLEIKEVEPGAIIRTAIQSVRPMSDKKSIRIEFDLSHESALIHADPDRLHQIISNLLTNAIKFSPVNSRIFVVLKYIEKQTKRFAQIKVFDQGKGISPEFISQIFDRFSQAESASTKMHGGLGLGLSIVKNLVELQSGTVSAENASEGKGAVFTVTFPLISLQKLAILQTEEAGGKEAGGNKPQPKLDGIRILIVDDDESTREAIAIYLKSFGAEVMDAESAMTALEKLASFKPNILVSDIAMPDEDGYSLIRKIRGLNPARGGDTPAVAVTAFTTSEDVKRALSAGFQAHMAKPVEANELGRVILKILEKK